MPIEVKGIRICRHVVDFVVYHGGGKTELLEVKGFETRDWRLKRKLVEALYPDIRYTVVK